MNFKYTNRTDLIIFGACILSLIAFSINTRLDSVIPVYINSLIILGVCTYWALRKDVTGMLRRSLIIGAVAGFAYTFVDRIFVDMWVIIKYLRPDAKVFATPLSIVLTFICCITIVMYFYQRLRSAFTRFLIPAALTGASAFLAGIAMGYFGDRARLWVWPWNTGTMPAPTPSIGPTPLPLLIALFLTFFLSPYIIGGQRITARIKLSDNPLAGGLRCAILLGMMMFFSFHTLSLAFYALKSWI